VEEKKGEKRKGIKNKRIENKRYRIKGKGERSNRYIIY